MEVYGHPLDGLLLLARSRTGGLEGVKLNGLIKKGVRFLKSADGEVQ